MLNIKQGTQQVAATPMTAPMTAPKGGWTITKVRASASKPTPPRT